MPNFKGAEGTDHVQHQHTAVLMVTMPDDSYCLDWICAVFHVESIRHEVTLASQDGKGFEKMKAQSSGVDVHYSKR